MKPILIIGGPYDARQILDLDLRVGESVLIIDETRTEHLHTMETAGTATYIRSQECPPHPTLGPVVALSEPAKDPTS
jgi:hypothetical protein